MIFEHIPSQEGSQHERAEIVKPPSGRVVDDIAKNAGYIDPSATYRAIANALKRNFPDHLHVALPIGKALTTEEDFWQHKGKEVVLVKKIDEKTYEYHGCVLRIVEGAGGQKSILLTETKGTETILVGNFPFDPNDGMVQLPPGIEIFEPEKKS